ncbi:hypothetical protein HK407_09g15110 [Ordospora pajunii]|uniref:uncharacterized protein n=1 Tax=Ordospora pajunii TaxID=3039483 RepID=UPI002952604A|nr:uncharacterized protein HK407_09g15110 [Ordospora pajunii]KAH9410916.1 hypothetical protein HK407_09g15110 [Ordospora pajunii]
MLKTCHIDQEVRLCRWSSASRLHHQYKQCMSLIDVRKCSREALKANPCNIQALYSLGKCHVEARNLKEAEAISNRLMHLGGTCEALVLKGHAYLCKGCLEDSHRSFLKAYHHAVHKDKFLIYGISLFYEAAGNYANARPWLVMLSRLGVEKYKDYEIMFRTGVCLKKMNRLSDSVDAFRVIVYNPFECTYDIGAQIQIAHLYEMQSKEDLAIEVLGIIRGAKVYSTAISRLLAWISFKKGDFEGVRRIHNEYEHKESDPYIVYLMGRIEFAKGSHDHAIRYYVKVINVGMMNGMVQNSLGCAYMQQGMVSEARRAFACALEANRESAEARRNLDLIARLPDSDSSGEPISNSSVLHEICEQPPSIANTGYLDSNVFLRGADHGVCPGTMPKVATMRISKFERFLD